jgi:hypothetical protein
VYEQVFDPVSDSLGLSSLFAVVPLATLFVLLGGVKLASQWAAPIALAVALVVAIVIAFCFGALLEALAGFGTPVAITAVMLIAIPIVTLSAVTERPKDDLGAMVGRQTPLLALIVPLILVGMLDGMRGILQVWPAAVVGGFAFGLTGFLCSNYVFGRAHRHRGVAGRDRNARRTGPRLAPVRADGRLHSDPGPAPVGDPHRRDRARAGVRDERVGADDRAGTLGRRAGGIFAFLLLAMCVIVYLQSTDVLGWMVVD